MSPKISHIEDVSVYPIALCDLFMDVNNQAERKQYIIEKQRSRSVFINKIVQLYKREYLDKEGKD